MYGELQEIRSRLTYKYDLPYKNLMSCEEDCAPEGHTDISWWNTVACMLSDTDMAELLESEGNYGYSDLEQEKAKRIRTVINELEFHESAVVKDAKVTLPGEAYA